MAGSFETRLGTSPEEGIKAPVVTITTAQIALTGEQDIGGLQVLDGDRVLVRAQDDPTENGIYDARVSAWTRATDFNEARDVVEGVLVLSVSDSNLYQAAFSGSWNPGVTAITFIKIDLSNAGGGGSGEFIPLAGTDINLPVTGPITFQNSESNDVYTMRSDILGTTSFGFLTELNGTTFIIATKNLGGVVQGFGFSAEGQFVVPSNSDANTEAWQIGSGTVGGDENVLLITPIDAFGGVRSHSAAIVVSPAYEFSFEVGGALVAPRATVPGDVDNTLVTKAYAEGLLPPGGGEANTASSPGASGQELTMAKVGIDLQFKKLIGGTDITLTPTADGITIDGSGGGGGGLPAGLIEQTLRNVAGTNTYEATGGLLVSAAGNVAVGPGSASPLVPLQVKGQISVLDGGLLAMNNPTNTGTGSINTTAGNRLTVNSPIAGGVDIFGGTSTGSAVVINANGQDVFIANGSVKSWAQILHGGIAHFRTIDEGCRVGGVLHVNALGTDIPYLTVNGIEVKARNAFTVVNNDDTESFMIVNASGNVSVGPGSVEPIVPLQVSGTATLLAGGQLNLNNPSDDNTGFINVTAGNRLVVNSPIAGGIDIKGATASGTAVTIQANGQEVFVANGSAESWAQIYHGGSIRFVTTSTGLQVTGAFFVKKLSDGNNAIAVSAVGRLDVADEIHSIGSASVASLQTTIGGITSIGQVNITIGAPTSADHATRKDYVDSGLAGKSATSHNHSGVYATVSHTHSNYLTNTGGSMSGAIDMNQNGIFDLPDPAAGTNATRKSYVDAAVSDVRLKKNIYPLNSPVLDLMDQVVPFTYENNGILQVKRDWHQVRYGLSAQAVEIAFPHAVHHLSTDRDDDGNSISGENYLGLDYADLVPVLWKAVQELNEKVDELQRAGH